MSRKVRFSRTNNGRKGRDHVIDDEYTGDERSAKVELPPRRKKYPSSLHNMNKWYYNMLFILFLGLVVFLFWYGNKFSS
ncbi:hypothetical protein ACX1C1_18365 [Paenibacillus sp. strain BS8-2]